MSWGEALGLLRILIVDPSAALAASIAGWEHPIDRTSLAVLDLFDLQHHLAWLNSGRKGPRPKLHPRPWKLGGKTKTAPSVEVTHDQIVAALRFAGHTAALPT